MAKPFERRGSQAATLAFAAAVAFFSACPGSTGATTTSSGGSTGGSSTTTGSTGTTGTGTTSGTTGTSGTTSGPPPDAGPCPDPATLPLTDCDQSLTELAGTVDDFCFGGDTAVQGALITDFVSARTATSDRCGDFHLCLMPGQPASLHVTKPGYWPTNVENVTPSGNFRFPLTLAGGGIQLMCEGYATSRLGSGQYFTPPADAGTGTVLAAIASAGNPACGGASAGWIIDAVIGADTPSQSRSYLDAEQEPLPIGPTTPGCSCFQCNCTGASQLALLYNLPVPASVQIDFTPPTDCPGPVDAGILTGEVALVANQLGYVVMQVP